MNTALGHIYPDTQAERDRWIIERRPARRPLDTEKPYAYMVEQEHFHTGEIGPVATIFLTNRECPWRCAMCDLWKNTVTDTVPIGSIPRQIEYALAHLPPARQVKLYNSGSFFDPRAILPEDYSAIAHLLHNFERVIVESHPALVRENYFTFQRLVDGELEVAMGLETAHPVVLQKLNKQMSLESYAAAASKLRAHDIHLRSFILLQPPFMAQEEALFWACRSIDFAVECGASAITLIPTRGGNGAMEALAASGAFARPSVALMEDALDYGIGRQKGRVFLDLWDIEQVDSGTCCRSERIDRLRVMNGLQKPAARVNCAHQRGHE